MTLDDTELWSLSKLGFTLYSRQRLGRAGALFHGLVQLRPQAAYCWYALGLIRRDQGAFREAVESLNQAMSCDAQFWRARVALAELLHTNGYDQDARAVLEPLLDRSVTADPAVRRGRTLLRCWEGRVRKS